jgi:hypothetical protein
MIAGVRSQASAERLQQKSSAKGSGRHETTLLDVTDQASIDTAIANTDKFAGPDGYAFLSTTPVSPSPGRSSISLQQIGAANST